MNEKKKKSIVIIGSGPGGYTLALLLSKKGFEVKIVEKKSIGGACLNVGCIPTKTLLDNLFLFEHFSDSVNKKKLFYGNDLTINVSELKKYQESVINQLSTGLLNLFKKNNIEFINGEASFIEKNKIVVKSETEERILTEDIFVIATGSKPKSIPGFEFDNKIVLSSDDIWNIPKVPQKMLILGSGPIGIEFARVFRALGSEIIICEIKESFCPILDQEISENLERSLKKRKIVVKKGTNAKIVDKKDDNATAKIEFLNLKTQEKVQEEFDLILVAAGREPNTLNLNLSKAEIKQKRNFIEVNQYLQTTNENTYAIGDVTDYPQLAHTASFQARTVAKNIYGEKTKFNSEFIPSCIFGFPEVAFIGKTEENIKEQGISYTVGKYSFIGLGKAKASGLNEGIVKVIMEKETKKILGAHIIGPEASSLIHELLIAMQNDITVDKIVGSIHAHPTYSEAVLEALEGCLGEAIHS